MTLFSKIYISLLIGIVGMLMIEGNLSYEKEIEMFQDNMAENSLEIGRIMSGMVAHAWRESGAGRAIELIEDSNYDNQKIYIKWVWLDELLAGFGKNSEDLRKQFHSESTEPVTYIPVDRYDMEQLNTFFPVDIGGARRGGLLLAQSLEPLAQFTQKMLLRSLFITSALALISGIIVFLFTYLKIRKPLEKLSRKAIEIGKGNLVADLDLKGDDELANLARSMNDMCTRLLIAKEKNHFEHLARLKTLEQLRHTEKLSTIGLISAGIAHEMGTPLNVVDGRAKMIISGSLGEEEIVNCATIIKNQSERMTNIIRHLLDFARKKKIGPKSRENITDAVHQVVKLLDPIAAKSGVVLEEEKQDGADLFVRMDASQMQQVFINLIVNGIHATPPQGKVQIRMFATQARSLIYTDDKQKKCIRVEIIDDGSGIEKEHLQEIFTPFFTTKQIGLGTGLGLSVALEIVEEHGGWIEVENRPVRGARFSVYLPAEEDNS